MTIRRIAEKDHDDFVRMVHAFYGSSAVQRDIPNNHAEDTFEVLMRRTPYADCLIAVSDEGTVLGYCLLALTWSNEAGGLCVWIDEVMVEPAARGQGVGTLLMREAQRLNPDAKRYRLETTASNRKAAALYKSLGFEALPYVQMTLDTQAHRM